MADTLIIQTRTRIRAPPSQTLCFVPIISVHVISRSGTRDVLWPEYGRYNCHRGQYVDSGQFPHCDVYQSFNQTFMKFEVKSASRRFQPGEGPSRGLLRDYTLQLKTSRRFACSSNVYTTVGRRPRSGAPDATHWFQSVNWWGKLTLNLNCNDFQCDVCKIYRFSRIFDGQFLDICYECSVVWNKQRRHHY